MHYSDELIPKPLPCPMNLAWTDDDNTWDTNLPAPGFITDFVYSLKGITTPSRFAAWTAISILSAALKTDVVLADYSRLQLYPNVFVILVGPPGLSGKSTATDYGVVEILNDFWKGLDPKDVHLALRKMTPLSRSRATVEGLINLLKVQTEKYLIETETGKAFATIEKDSHLWIFPSELSSFLGQKQYMSGLVEFLTCRYDRQPLDTDVLAKGKHKLDTGTLSYDNAIQFRNQYVVLCGATTPDCLESAIPKEAYGDGFLSRVFLIRSKRIERIRPWPELPDGKDLQQRLLWIAKYHQGEYRFSIDARNAYEFWYRSWLEPYKDGTKTPPLGSGREHTLVCKLALLLRCNRYEPGNEISLSDFNDALRLFVSAQEDKIDILNEMHPGKNENHTTLNKIRNFFSHRKGRDVPRQEVQKWASSQGMLSNQVSLMLDELQELGELSIWKVNGTKRNKQRRCAPGVGGMEVYFWEKED